MKILLIIKNFDFGGAENHVCLLANQLVENGHQVFIVSRFGLQIQFLNPKVIHLSLQLSDTLIPVHFIQLVKLIRKEKIEIIHAHQRIAILLAGFLGRATATPIIATIHGRIKHDLRSDFVKKSIQKFITVSKNSQKGASSNPYICYKSVLILNAVKIPANPNHPKPIETPVIYYASRFDKRHSGFISMLIEEVWPSIAKNYSGIRLFLTGDGPGLKNILKKAEQFNYTYKKNSIVYIGFQPNALAGIQSASLVLGVGRIAIESLAAGIPVLSVNAKHIGEIITTSTFSKYKYGNFVAIDNLAPTQNEIIDQIEKFLSNPEFYKNEAQKLQTIVLGEFDIDKTTDQIIELYKELVQSKSEDFTLSEALTNL